MNSRTLVNTLIVTLIGIVVANWILSIRLRHTLPRLLQHEIASSSHADTVAIGNSVIAGGFDVAKFDHILGTRSINAGLGGVGFVQQYVAWRMVLERNAGLKTLILGTFDHYLTNMTHSHWTSWHSSEAFAFYGDPSWAARYGCVNSADETVFRVMRHIPMFTERGGPWTKVEQLRRSLGAIGLSTTESNRFGRVTDSASLLEQDMDIFKLTSQRMIQKKAALAAPVADLLNEARIRGISSFVVMMPLPRERREFYLTPEWKSYVEYIRGLLNYSGSQLIEATDWVDSPEDFVDFVHLSKSGAVLFSTRLAETMSLQQKNSNASAHFFDSVRSR